MLREQVARDVPPVAGTLPSDSVGNWSPLPLFEKPESANVGDLPAAPFLVEDVEVPDREAIAREVAEELRSSKGPRRLIELARQWKHDRPLVRLLTAALRTMGFPTTADQFSTLHQFTRPEFTACETRLGPTPWLNMATELPDEFDGLTATQRLLLEVMREAAPPGRPFLRLSEIAAEVAVREARCDQALVERTLISLGHPSLRRVPLVEFQGFTGRFTPLDTHLTHARLSREAIEVLDETFPLPLLLVNGAEGINGCVPPHRPKELIAACLHLVASGHFRHWELPSLEGPDFPEGGVLVRTGAQPLWAQGEGWLVRRARAQAEADTQARARVVIDQVPWPLSARKLQEELEALRIDGVTNVVDHSSAEGVRLVVELEHVAFTGPVLDAINKSRVCECSFRAEFLVRGSPTPRRLDLVDLLKAFIEHRREVAVKKLDRALAQAKLRAQTAEAVCVALALIEPVQAVMRAADDDPQAIAALTQFMRPEHRAALATLPFPASHDYAQGFTGHQAKHLVSLRRLAARRPDSARQDWAELLSQCDVAAALLNDRQAILDVVRQELRAALSRFGEPRRTRLD